MERLTSLPENHIFVFGSNLLGAHRGGAAKDAFDYFGAIIGKAEGIQGQSYAIPTLDRHYKQLPLRQILLEIEWFLSWAFLNSKETFHVTPIGCGIAGFTPEQIATLFEACREVAPTNIVWPDEFKAVSKWFH